MRSLCLYGPPGSGKTTLGKLLAERLNLPFIDLDLEIQNQADKPIHKIFSEEGEAGFRAREKQKLKELLNSERFKRERSVIALGGGTLLDDESRGWVEEHAKVLCLACSLDVLRSHIKMVPGDRPLLHNGLQDSDQALKDLLAKRKDHYASFPLQLDVAGYSQDSLIKAAEILFGAYHITSGDVPCDVIVGENCLNDIGKLAENHGLGKRVVVVGDTNTKPLYVDLVVDSLRKNGFQVTATVIKAGEEFKNINTIQEIWRFFQQAGLGRDDFAVAVGGGVVGDQVGFAAATWMRGMAWINVPTTLLAMVDASTGGKTGCDLPGAKNMIGAFHSPAIVLADVGTLLTLPVCEWRCGLAEAIKHGFIADVEMFNQMDLFNGISSLKPEDTFDTLSDLHALALFVSRSLAVKVNLVRQDPREKGVRAKLNLGHTVGHAIEVLTNYQVRHGEAVAIGTVEEARIATHLGFANEAWPNEVVAAFAKVGLPTKIPSGITAEALRKTMYNDKKKRDGKIRLALPCALGEVCVTTVEEQTLREVVSD